MDREQRIKELEEKIEKWTKTINNLSANTDYSQADQRMCIRLMCGERKKIRDELDKILWKRNT